MSLADQLKAVSLRKTSHAESKQNDAKNSLLESLRQESDHNARLRACDLEAWYDEMREHTFRTEFVTLSPREAEALIVVYWSKLRSQGSASDIRHPCSEGRFADAMSFEQAEKTLEMLKTRIDATLQELDPGNRRGVFAKLSSRSPKDSRFCETRALKAIQSDIAQKVSSSTKENLLDTEIIFKAVMKHSVASLCLFGSSEIVEAFTTSDRVCEDDLVLALSFRNKIWSQHIVLREWIEIPNFCELRGFVVDGKLTALSQYFVGVHFPELVAQKDHILKLVLEEFSGMVDKIPLQPKDCVADFAVDLNSNRVYLIEFNPFGRPDGLGTGTALFDLKGSDHDRKVLFGELPFEFRVQTPRVDSEGKSSSQDDLKKLLSDGPLKKWLVGQDIIKIKM